MSDVLSPSSSLAHPLASDGAEHAGYAHVAVYGTLRAGGRNDIQRLSADARLEGHTTLRGTLFDLGWYPGLALNGSQEVLAEVYHITPALEQRLDQIEGILPEPNDEYVKRVLLADVRPADGSAVRMLPVLVYEITPAFTQGRSRIEESDWLAWDAKR